MTRDTDAGAAGAYSPWCQVKTGRRPNTAMAEPVERKLTFRDAQARDRAMPAFAKAAAQPVPPSETQ